MSETGPSGIPRIDKTRRNLLKAIGGAVIAMPGILAGRNAFEKRQIDGAQNVIGQNQTQLVPQESEDTKTINEQARPVMPDTNSVVLEENSGVNTQRISSLSEKAKQLPDILLTSLLSHTELAPELRQNLDKVLSYRLNDPKRDELENNLAKSARTVKEIDAYCMVVQDLTARDILRNKRFEFRQLAKDGLKPLSQEKVQFSREWKLHTPETIALVEETEAKAALIIDKIKEVLRPGSQGMDPHIFMAPVGEMIGFMDSETGGFSNIGFAEPIDEINDVKFPTAKEDLRKLLVATSKDTGLFYTEHNVPGSKDPFHIPGINGTSGGAIGAQIMPDNFWRIYSLVKEKTGYTINPFVPEDAVIASWIYLVSAGYRRDDEDRAESARQLWNHDKAQRARIKQLAAVYTNQFEKAA